MYIHVLYTFTCTLLHGPLGLVKCGVGLPTGIAVYHNTAKNSDNKKNIEYNKIKIAQ